MRGGTKYSHLAQKQFNNPPKQIFKKHTPLFFTVLYKKNTQILLQIGKKEGGCAYN